MTAQFPSKLYNHLHLLLLLFTAWLTYSSCQCVESERDALLHFKQGIHVDNCGILDDWEHTHDCCQWHGISCNNQSGHVIGLNLSDYEGCLEGTLSVSLLNLKHLKYLDLSYNNFSEALPKFIGSIGSLETLDLSDAHFQGLIPQEIGNLSSLTSLDLSGNNLRAKSLWWLSRLTLIREVDLSFTDMSTTSNTLLSIVNNLPFLQVLSLDECSLSLNSPSSLSYINSSTTLSVLSLSANNLNDTSIFEWLLNLSGLETSLTYLDVSNNYDMFGNNLQLSERSMKSLDNLCSLQTLDMSFTNLNYRFDDIIKSFSTRPHKALVSLQLSSNQVWGSIPEDIGAFASLRILEVDRNQLNGTISQALGQLKMLEMLSLGSNSLKGTLTSAHFSNLYKLSFLDLSNNTEVVVNISSNCIPPFQLTELNLRSCKIGPYFPRWITTQKYLDALDISNASISDTIPISFWNSIFLPGITTLDMSHNMINGTIPDVSTISFHGKPNFDLHPKIIDLSYNLLEGTIPSFLRNNNVSYLYLNNNKFSKGLLPFLCPHTNKPLSDLDLSSNLFSEKLPDCWSYFDRLQNLHLENNSLWGSLPTSMGALNLLRYLHLSNNNLSGSLPASLVNCPLVILDLAYNSIIGHIPSNFGHSFMNLAFLSLRSNRFVGVLPKSFCDLSYLQILDVSDNYISGTIPRCLYKLVRMTNLIDAVFSALGEDEGSVIWKRYEQTFGSRHLKKFILGKPGSFELLKGIDISNNRLEGHIPEGISSLVGLKFLNLSRNNLTGAIVSRIGQLASLESLDLSHNHLSGEIPPSLAQISCLSTFDISDNNLTGKIPLSTQLQGFDASSYTGNPGLCGPPLPKCVVDVTPSIVANGNGKQDMKDDYFMLGLYISVVLGFITGFWGVCGTLVVKTSWRHAYFRFYEETRDKIYVIWVVKIARAWRRS